MATMITVHVLFFAGQRDIVGGRDTYVSLPEPATVADLWNYVVAQSPRMANYTGRVLFGVNQELSSPSTPLRDGDEVALIPPVSGG